MMFKKEGKRWDQNDEGSIGVKLCWNRVQWKSVCRYVREATRGDRLSVEWWDTEQIEIFDCKYEIERGRTWYAGGWKRNHWDERDKDDEII